MTDTANATNATNQPAMAPVVAAQSTLLAPPMSVADEIAKARIDAQKALLAQLGVQDVSEVESALKLLKEKQDAEKTETEKLREQASRAAVLEQQTRTQAEALKAYAESSMAALSESQKKAVLDIAGADPVAQLRAVSALRGTWSQPAVSQTNAAAPANTLPSTAAPPPASVGSPNHLQAWRELQKKNPIVAASYRLKFGEQIEKQLATQTA